VKIHKIYWII